jgi:uncharacterized membrane protein
MRRIGLVLLWLLVIPTLLYSMMFYVVMPLAFPVKVGWQIDPILQESIRTHTGMLYLHIVPSAIALLVGLVQLRPAANAPRPPRHALLGRLYAVMVLVGGISGLYLAFFSFAGLVSQLGFALLAIAWLVFTGMAVHRIRQGDRAAHREWMIRSYALTLAGVTLRIGNIIWFSADYELSEFHMFNAWLCWVPNLVVAEIWLRITRKPLSSATSLRVEGVQ